MGFFPSCVLIFFFFFFFFFLASSLNVHGRDDDPIVSPFHNSAAIPSPTPPLKPPPPRKFSPFKPSVAVIVGVLTTLFSITFLLLLYAKHCRHRGGRGYPRGNDEGVASPSTAVARKNSGIDRSVVESLPVFRFGSLRGQKEGLDCAVCLTRFDPAAVLRLLPKCKHAFHVECVDTWLDAHSTCPLCRYRVDPEDVLLVGDPRASVGSWQDTAEEEEWKHTVVVDIGEEAGDGHPLETRQLSGRHSEGERAGKQKRHGGDAAAATLRRSVNSARGARNKSEAVAVGCFDRGPRKDALLLTEDENGTAADDQRTSTEERRRLEHRIIVSPRGEAGDQRWSDVQPSDLLYLRSEMIISDSRRSPSGSRGRSGKQEQGQGGGSSVIKGRSVSEITGMSRLSSNNHERRGRRQMETDTAARLASRWLAWISQSPSVRSGA